MPVLDGATTTLASLGQWSQPIFDSMKPYGYTEAGILIGVALILFLVSIGGSILYYIRHKNH